MERSSDGDATNSRGGANCRLRWWVAPRNGKRGRMGRTTKARRCDGTVPTTFTERWKVAKVM